MSLFIAFTAGFAAGFILLWFIGDWFGNYKDFQAGLSGESRREEYRFDQIEKIVSRYPAMAKLKTLLAEDENEDSDITDSDITAILDEIIRRDGDIETILDEMIKRTQNWPKKPSDSQ